jgi:hypothetical protein
MARQKFRSARLGGFSGTKAYIQYVEILKKRRNAVGRFFVTPSKLAPVFRRQNRIRAATHESSFSISTVAGGKAAFRLQ